MSKSRKSQKMSQKTQKLMKAANLISDTLKSLDTPSFSTQSQMAIVDVENVAPTNVIQPDSVSNTEKSDVKEVQVLTRVSKEEENVIKETNIHGLPELPPLPAPKAYHPLFVDGQNLTSIFEADSPTHPIFTPFVPIQRTIKTTKSHPNVSRATGRQEDDETRKRMEHLEYENGLLRQQVSMIIHETTTLSSQVTPSIIQPEPIIIVKENESLKKEIEMIQDQLSARFATQNPLQEQMETLKTQLESAVNDGFQQSNTLFAKCETLESRNQQLQDRLDSLNSSVKLLTHQNDQLQNENTRLIELKEQVHERIIERIPERVMDRIENPPEPAPLGFRTEEFMSQRELNLRDDSVIELTKIIERHIQWASDQRRSFQINSGSSKATFGGFSQHVDSVIALFQTLRRVSTGILSQSTPFNPIQFVNMCTELSELLAVMTSELVGNYIETVDLEKHVDSLQQESMLIRKEAEQTISSLNARHESEVNSLHQAQRDLKAELDHALERLNYPSNDHSQELDKAMDKIDSLKAQLSDAQKELSRANAASIRTSFEQLMDPNAYAKEDLQKLSNQVSELKNLKIHLETHVAHQEETIDQWKQQNEELRDQLNARGTNTTQIDKRVEEQKRRIQHLESKVEDEKLKVAMAEEHIRVLKESNQSFPVATHMPVSDLKTTLQNQLKMIVEKTVVEEKEDVNLESFAKLLRENDDTSSSLKSFGTTLEGFLVQLKNNVEENEILEVKLASMKEKLETRESVWTNKAKALREECDTLLKEQQVVNDLLLNYQNQYSSILVFFGKDVIEKSNSHPFAFMDVFAQLKKVLEASDHQLSSLSSSLGESKHKLSGLAEQLAAQSLATSTMTEETQRQQHYIQELELKRNLEHAELTQLKISLSESLEARKSIEKKLKKIVEGYKLMVGVTVKQ